MATSGDDGKRAIASRKIVTMHAHEAGDVVYDRWGVQAVAKGKGLQC